LLVELLVDGALALTAIAAGAPDTLPGSDKKELRLPPAIVESAGKAPKPVLYVPDTIELCLATTGLPIVTIGSLAGMAGLVPVVNGVGLGAGAFIGSLTDTVSPGTLFDGGFELVDPSAVILIVGGLFVESPVAMVYFNYYLSIFCST
jgi:hypothetical protein